MMAPVDEGGTAGGGRVRVAFLGKGGAGKSTIAGTFARLLARRGEPVLALDSDPMPGLPFGLGVEVDDRPIPDDVVVDGPDGGPRWVLAPGLGPADVIDRYAVACPDGVRYLQFGNTSGDLGAVQRAQFAWSETVHGLDRSVWHLVGDLPGGTRQAMFGWGKYAEHALLVVEPTAKSLHTARRLLRLDRADWGPTSIGIVANKVRDEDDVARIEERLERAVTVRVPWSTAVVEGDRQAGAPLDVDPGGPFVAAVDGLVDRIVPTYDQSVEAS